MTQLTWKNIKASINTVYLVDQLGDVLVTEILPWKLAGGSPLQMRSQFVGAIISNKILRPVGRWLNPMVGGLILSIPGGDIKFSVRAYIQGKNVTKCIGQKGSYDQEAYEFWFISSPLASMASVSPLLLAPYVVTGVLFAENTQTMVHDYCDNKEIRVRHTINENYEGVTAVAIPLTIDILAEPLKLAIGGIDGPVISHGATYFVVDKMYYGTSYEQAVALTVGTLAGFVAWRSTLAVGQLVTQSTAVNPLGAPLNIGVAAAIGAVGVLGAVEKVYQASASYPLQAVKLFTGAAAVWLGMLTAPTAIAVVAAFNVADRVFEAKSIYDNKSACGFWYDLGAEQFGLGVPCSDLLEQQNVRYHAKGDTSHVCGLWTDVGAMLGFSEPCPRLLGVAYGDLTPGSSGHSDDL